MENPAREGLIQEEWLQALMAQHGTAVLRLCYGYLKDAGLAEDAAQETFFKAWKRQDAFAAVASEKAFLMRIAINVCKDTLRSAWFRHVDRRVELDAALLTARETLMPGQRRLADAIMGLKARDRVVILLHYYQELGVDEIAQVLGISRPAVYYRLKQAKKQLKAAIEKEDRDG